MKYKRVGNNQFRKANNSHYVLYYLYSILLLVLFISLPKLIKKPEILTPLAQAQSVEVPTTKTIGASSSASPQMTDNSSKTAAEDEAEQKRIEDYVKIIFGKDAKTAIAVSRNECGPTNRAYPKCVYHTEHEYSVGIFQINLYNKSHLIHASKVPGETMEEKIEWLKEPQNNVLMAYWIFTKSGWYPWSAYTNGAYLKDM